MNSITKRWVRGSLLITFVVLLLAESVFVYFLLRSSYDGVRNALRFRTQTLITQLAASDAQTPESRSTTLRRMVEQFSEKDRFELTLLDNNGRVALSSTGYVPRQTGLNAGEYSGEVSSRRYTTSLGERVMSYTTPLTLDVEEFAAIRIITSLELVDRSNLQMLGISIAIVLCIVLFSVWSGLFFIRSIVRPIAAIEHTAAKMAEGNLDIRIEDTYNDEIGKLAGTINHMAGELDKSERMKNEFISSVSHELRTPLTSIKGWIETLVTIHDPADPSYTRGLRVIASETDRLYDMVEELLDFSRLQNGIALQPTLLDLVAEVSDSLLTVGERIRLEGLQLVYDEPQLPIPIMADPGRLRQVFINVLDNAIKYSPPGSAITVRALTDGTLARVCVIDEGRGISPQDLENVKVKFFKGKGAIRGSGIGLAVVDEIMRAHGGALDIESTLDEGTTVWLSLPVYNTHSDQ